MTSGSLFAFIANALQNLGDPLLSGSKHAGFLCFFTFFSDTFVWIDTKTGGTASLCRQAAGLIGVGRSSVRTASHI